MSMISISVAGRRRSRGTRARAPIGSESKPFEPQIAPATSVPDDLPDEQERQVKLICDVLNAFGVEYVVFGSFAGRLQGVPLRTLDVDVVPEASAGNLQRPCDAFNSLEPRWRVDDVSEGLRIDGRKLEPRDIDGSSVLLGREKDLEHLPLLIARRAELEREIGVEVDRGRGREGGPGNGYGFGF
jgi:hypothetical protein